MEYLKSRTLWTIAIMVGLQALQIYEGVLQPNLFMLLQTVLGALAMYFRVDAKTTFPAKARNLVSKKKK